MFTAQVQQKALINFEVGLQCAKLHNHKTTDVPTKKKYQST